MTLELGSNQPIWSVSQLNQQVHHLLTASFPTVLVEGEISNFSASTAGHWYFSIKDSDAQISCAMFRGKNRLVATPIENGMQIVVQAQVSLYTKGGQYQLIVDQVFPAGSGLLQQKFEQLKKQLHAEGLFHSIHKKSIPKIPNAIGIITSPTGAALHDIIHVIQRRFPSVHLILYPTLVQGSEATQQIIKAIDAANEHNQCDVLIVARGGGSLEDLWCFNEESVARAIFKSQLPIITGIGHEVDITIADLVGDLRAPTPSAAAESATPSSEELLSHTKNLKQRMRHLTAIKLNTLQQHSDHLQHRLKTQHPKNRLTQHKQLINTSLQILNRAIQKIVQKKQHQLSLYKHTLYSAPLNYRLKFHQEKLEMLDKKLSKNMQLIYVHYAKTIAHLAQSLHQLSPLQTVQRGYAIVTDPKTHKLIHSTKDCVPGQLIDIQMNDGNIEAEVK